MEEELKKLRSIAEQYKQDVDGAMLIYLGFKRVLEEASRKYDAKSFRKLQKEAANLLGETLFSMKASKQVVSDYMKELWKIRPKNGKESKKEVKKKPVKPRFEERTEKREEQKEVEASEISKTKSKEPLNLWEILALLFILAASLLLFFSLVS